MSVLMILHHGPIFLKVLPDKEAAQKKYAQIRELTPVLEATVVTDFDFDNGILITTEGE